jgi:uncharacterized protein (UPF0332 family)
MNCDLKKPNYDDLVKKESLKKEDRIDYAQIERLIIRSKKDIQVARKNLNIDEATALELVYKSMFHASNALIRSQGYRPGKIKQHIGVVEAVERSLGAKIKPIILKFDRLRIKRNEFEYQGLYRSSKTEIKNGLQDAEKLIKSIEDYIEKNNPQRKLHF